MELTRKLSGFGIKQWILNPVFNSLCNPGKKLFFQLSIPQLLKKQNQDEALTRRALLDTQKVAISPFSPSCFLSLTIGSSQLKLSNMYSLPVTLILISAYAD